MAINVNKLIKQATRDGNLSKVDLANATIEMLNENGTGGVKPAQRKVFMQSMRAVSHDTSVRMSKAVRTGLKDITSVLGDFDSKRKVYAPELDADGVLDILSIRSAKGLSEKANKLVEHAKNHREILRLEADEIRAEIGSLQQARYNLEFKLGTSSAQDSASGDHGKYLDELRDVNDYLDRLNDRLAEIEDQLPAK